MSDLFDDEVDGEEGDEFFETLEADFGEFLGVDPAQVVTLRSSSGQSWPVAIDGPTKISELVDRAGLTVSANVTAWLDGAQVTLDTEVPGGTMVALIGNVKGG